MCWLACCGAYWRGSETAWEAYSAAGEPGGVLGRLSGGEVCRVLAYGLAYRDGLMPRQWVAVCHCCGSECACGRVGVLWSMCVCVCAQMCVELE